MSAHRYWRIHVTANNEPSGWASIQMAELQFRATVGGAALTGTWSAPPTDSGPDFVLANVHDDNFATAYASLGGFVPVDTQITLDLGAGNDSDVLEVAISPREATHTYAPRTFDIQASDDGATFTTIASYANIPVTDYADDTYKTFAVYPPTDAYINQMPLISVVSEVSPPSGGALINQIAIVSVNIEYQIPLHLHGWLVKSIQGFPYFIQGDGL